MLHQLHPNAHPSWSKRTLLLPRLCINCALKQSPHCLCPSHNIPSTLNHLALGPYPSALSIVVPGIPQEGGGIMLTRCAQRRLPDRTWGIRHGGCIHPPPLCNCPAMGAGRNSARRNSCRTRGCCDGKPAQRRGRQGPSQQPLDRHIQVSRRLQRCSVGLAVKEAHVLKLLQLRFIPCLWICNGRGRSEPTHPPMPPPELTQRRTHVSRPRCPRARPCPHTHASMPLQLPHPGYG